jgi:hypothetical protein
MPKSKIRKILLVQLLMLPAEASYFVFPALRMFEPLWKHTDLERISYTRTMTFMIAPYFLVSIVVLIFGWLLERDSVMREERAINCLLIVPAGLCLFLSSYLIPSIGVVGAWKINVAIILAVLRCLSFSESAKASWAFTCVRRMLRVSQTQEAVIQSSGVLHHALKNNLLTTRLPFKTRNITPGRKMSRERRSPGISIWHLRPVSIHWRFWTVYIFSFSRF